MRASRIALLALAVLTFSLLAACGGPSTGGPLPAPTLGNVTPEAAPRGGTITLAGNNFGATEGTVMVGGAPATITSWGNTSIVATVPASAPNAWQSVTVTTSAGTASRDGLFVGVEYTGAVGGLQVFLDAQSAGTAVLMPATTYDLNTGPIELFVRGLDLYGRGASETTLQLGPLHVVWLLADFGAQASLADLTINSGIVIVGADSPLTTASVPIAEEIEQLSHTARASVSFRGVRLEETLLATDASYFSNLVDVRLEDTEVVGGTLDLVTYGDYVIDGLTMDSPNAWAGMVTYVGSLVVQNSQLTTMTAWLSSNGGVQVQDSHIEVVDGQLSILGEALTDYLGVPVPGGPVRITGSTIRVLDGDLTDGTVNGDLRISTAEAPISIENNPSITAWGQVLVRNEDTNLGAGGIRLAGNEEVRVGVSPADDPANPRLGNIRFFSEGAGQRVLIELVNNNISAYGDLEIWNDGARDLRVTDNRMTLSDENTVGSFGVFGTGLGPVTLSGNTVTAAAQVSFSGLNLASTAFDLLDNTFTIAGGALVGFEAGGTGGACTFTGNTIDLQASGTQPAEFLFGCGFGSWPFDVTENEVSVTGAAGSSLDISSSATSALTLTRNQLRSSGEMAVLADVATFDVIENQFHTQAEALIFGSFDYAPGAHLRFVDNTVTQQNPVSNGLIFGGVGRVTMENNTAEVLGAYSPASVALTFAAEGGHLDVVATGNTFTNYGNALYFYDNATTEFGLDATLTDNTFRFPITAAPQVATLENIGTTIVATENQWGDNTSLAAVRGYVSRTGLTDTRGGSIDLDPITPPPAGP